MSESRVIVLALWLSVMLLWSPLPWALAGKAPNKSGSAARAFPWTVLEEEKRALQLLKEGESNAVGRSSAQQCASSMELGGLTGYSEAPGWSEGNGKAPFCVVDDCSGSDAEMWIGLDEQPHLTPPPYDPLTGRHYTDFSVGRPSGVGLLRVERGMVFNCENGGTVFNQTMALRLNEWYHKLPPARKPQASRIQHVPTTLVSLCVPYADTFQHAMLDMAPKLSISLNYLKNNPTATVLHGKGASELLRMLGMKNTILAQKGVIYSAPKVVQPYFPKASGTARIIGMSTFHSAHMLRDRLLNLVSL
mmetsp:Transcript_30050/g.84800  ORF Transcript_30050/g.84800 Transcript_30050/m.84800 type:complete len:305 (-) Transcript_30050:1783-2697(-)